METFSALLAFCAGNSPVTGEFPSQRPLMRTFAVFWTKGWVNNQDAGHLRRHRAHYAVTVMAQIFPEDILKFNSSSFHTFCHVPCGTYEYQYFTLIIVPVYDVAFDLWSGFIDLRKRVNGSWIIFAYGECYWVSAEIIGSVDPYNITFTTVFP